MKPILLESGHASLSTANVLHSANAALRQACAAMPPLELHGLAFSWRMMHLGQGSYATGESTSYHVHKQLHLESILSGRFRFEHESGALDITPGLSLFVLPHERHRWQCTQAGAMMGALINISGPAQQEFLELVRQQTNGMIRVNPASCATWYRELLRLLTSPGSAPWHLPAMTSILRLLMIDLLDTAVDLSRWHPDAAAETGDVRAHDLCRHAHEFIETNCDQPIQIRDVAMQIGISTRHLTRLYKRIKGESVGAALQELRLQRARRHLRAHPEDIVKTVASRCGFSSPAYFTACYRKAFGITPAQDRYRSG